LSVYIEYPYLLAPDFLKEVDELKFREEYGKITLLDWEENELEDIEGIIQSGNINIDSSSAMRRTATLSFVVAEDTLSYTDAVSKIAINKKIKLAVGIKNTLTQFLNYDILWFPQGMFVINAV
jgi:hypothetical protein